MRKDTESLGNDKAPACESRGFVTALAFKNPHI